MGLNRLRIRKRLVTKFCFFPNKYVVYSTNLVAFRHTHTFCVVVECGLSHRIKNTHSGGCRDSSVSAKSGCEVDKTSPYGAKVLELRVHSTMASLLRRGAN